MALVMANETARAQHRTAGHLGRVECGPLDRKEVIRRKLPLANSNKGPPDTQEQKDMPNRKLGMSENCI